MKSKQIEAFAVMAVNSKGKVIMYHVASIHHIGELIIDEFEEGAVSVSIVKEILDDTTQTSPAECV